MVMFDEGHYQSQIKAAHRFVVENYQHGDHVILLGWLGWEKVRGPWYAAIRQLAASLVLPLACLEVIYQVPGFQYIVGDQTLSWSAVDRILSDFPSTVENFLCKSPGDAYVVQRGSYGQDIRKEAWLRTDGLWRIWLDWLMVRHYQRNNAGNGTSRLNMLPNQLQTSHIIQYHPSDLIDASNPCGLVRELDQPQLLSAATHSNWNKHRRGVPCDDAIQTGGQLTRLSKVTWPGPSGDVLECLVWSYQSFAEGEYDGVHNAPLVGPRHIYHKTRLARNSNLPFPLPLRHLTKSARGPNGTKRLCLHCTMIKIVMTGSCPIIVRGMPGIDREMEVLCI
ncbi:hypothetical protein BDV93DRAFT_513195 [Ceratobasidium sp. AG-I]|nr:hypothetical protein BDV93DRAFT_513195 [Ceratobasidium sp. AG-I]